MSRRKTPPNWLFRLVAGIVAAGLLLVVLDFVAFAGRAAKAKGDPSARADAVVALTGGSGLRIAAGIDLVAAGKGERLLISGVHPDVEIEDLTELAGGSAQIWGCCVDIGHRATTTLGNADETAAWAYERGYKRLIIVTSDYHMPRSLIVLRNAMEDVELVPYPVRTVHDPSAIWKDPKSFRGVLIEWAKWRVTTLG